MHSSSKIPPYAQSSVPYQCTARAEIKLIKNVEMNRNLFSEYYKLVPSNSHLHTIWPLDVVANSFAMLNKANKIAAFYFPIRDEFSIHIAENVF